MAQPISYRYPQSGENMANMLPFFFNDLDNVIPNVNVSSRIISHIQRAVRLGEDKFQQAFGGWMPKSNEFGIVPLRPYHVGLPDNRWQWTDGTTSSVFWSAEESFINHTLGDKEIVLIYGYFNLEPVPSTLELWIQPGPTKFPIWNIVPHRLSKNRYFVLPSPIIIEPLSTLKIVASTASGATAVTEEAGLLGYYLAPLATLITTKSA